MNHPLQRFVSIVGHEFRTALTGILGFSNLMKEPHSYQEEIADQATFISPFQPLKPSINMQRRARVHP